MVTATVKQLKDELKLKSQEELVTLCLELSKFKKESKELLTYLLFESEDEQEFISGVKVEITEEFDSINTSNIYYVKKGVRKILRTTKKYIRYSKKKQTEVELLMHFCYELKNMGPTINRSSQLKNLYSRQFEQIKKSIRMLHEDLQYDYELELGSI